MMIFKKAIPRRTFLRGMGATVALPLLDGMVPAFASSAESAAVQSPMRLGIVYVPNGIVMDNWTPAAEGAAFELTPILQPLAPFRDRLVVLSGLSSMQARSLAGEAGGAHARASAAYLTGVHAKQSEGSDMRLGVSMDQIAAQTLGEETQLASLELAMDSTEVAGACDGNFACSYSNTLSWRTPTQPVPMENNPRTVFARLFGDGGTADPRERLTRIRRDRSILDSVMGDVSRLLTGVGPSDHAKLDEYLDSVRDVERRIQRASEQASREMPAVEQPFGIPDTYTEHVKLMFDLQVLAYQSDMTRVITFMMGREQSYRAYPELGIPDPHHPLTHHQGDTSKIAKVLQINKFHANMFAYFLEKLRATRDGDGSLLDQMVMVYGGGISDGNKHEYDDLPTLLVGGGAGQIKGGRHLRYPDRTPITNLYLTMLTMINIPVEKLGDSTEGLELLSV